jgi:lipopolysaccharide export system permease protein
MLLKIFKYQNTIISRYLLSNLIVFFFAITFIIGLIVFGNQFVLTAQESISFGIPIKELMPLVGFNMLRDIPIILTLSLFLSIIITISQLYKNSEAVVMNSIGLGDKNFMNLIKPIVFFTFIIIFYLTIFAVPWAKQQKSYAEDETVNASEFSFITEGKFESFKNGEIVFYASESKVNDIVGEQNMEEIFIYALGNESPVIVLASEAKKYTDAENDSIKKGILPYGFDNTTASLKNAHRGSLNHQFKWNLFDQVMISQSLHNDVIDSLYFHKADIFDDIMLRQWKGKYRGQPARTFVGLTYKGGYSDHFPVFAIFRRN